MNHATSLLRPAEALQSPAPFLSSNVTVAHIEEPSSSMPARSQDDPVVSPTVAWSHPTPLLLTVPAAKIDVSLNRLFENQEGQLEAPSTPESVGWWRKQKKDSPIVLAGHVDSKTGPAVFFHIKDLRFGDQIFLSFDDGSNVSYTVRQLERAAKNDFPSQQVYNSGVGEIRLVTCGGKFNRRTGHYEDNVIVFATSNTA